VLVIRAVLVGPVEDQDTEAEAVEVELHVRLATVNYERAVTVYEDREPLLVLTLEDADQLAAQLDAARRELRALLPLEA
jgi:hypothetical protein